MALYEFEGKRPQIPADSFVHPAAVLIGDIRLGRECLIAPGVVIRADFGPVEIGNHSMIQDNSIIHVSPDVRVVIADNVIIAHGVILHDVHIKARCIIGMGAILMFNVVCSEDVIVAAGSLVSRDMRIPAGKIVSGNPATVIHDVSEKQKQTAREGVEAYRDLCRRYLTTMKLVG